MKNSEIIKINAKSSNGDNVYTVTFIIKNNRMSIHCSCHAGIYGHICKHRISFLKGEKSYLSDNDDIDKLNYIAEWVKHSEYSSHLKNLKKLEQSVEKAKKNLKQFKADFAEDMKIGILKWD